MFLGTRLRGRPSRIAVILLASILGVCAAPGVDDAQSAAAWRNFGANSQHTGLSASAAQSLEVIHWSTPVDLAPPGGTIVIHYGSPLVTPANTVIIPIKTSTGYQVDARRSKDGSLIWSAPTDYILPSHNWTPSYSPALTASNRVYFPGAGGTVYYRDNVDAPGSVTQLAFFGLATYLANRASFDATVFINTPITVDSVGNIYFGFRTSGTAPLGLQSGIARIGADGSGLWISATAAAGGDPSTTRVPHQAAPALSNDEHTLYVAVAGTNNYLVGLDPATLNPKEVSPGVPMRVPLKDPRNGGVNNAWVTDDSSSSPMVGPDGDVYYGVLGTPFNTRGWLLHFSGNLTQTKTPGAFGWDNTPAVVPVSAVPSYAGPSTYLIFSKYNNYAGSDGGDGVNKIAVLDPNATQVESHPSSNGQLVMKEILTIAGPTPDPGFLSTFPLAVREWCINTAAVDPVTQSVMVNSEDGKLYRWHLPSNTLSQAVILSAGVGEAYTPTAIGSDGTAYAINRAVLSAVGQRPTIAIDDVSVTEGNSGTTAAVFTVTLSSSSTETVSVSYATADGTATLAGNDYQSVSGTLTFMPGETSKTISVLVAGDTSNEGDEWFFVNLSTPVNATIDRGQGRGTILSDDQPDTTPDAFSFTSQTGVALSTTATSNTITVSGISAAVPISVSGGTYSVNSGAFTGVAGTVNNGDTVSVRLVSASSGSTQTCATLTIGGVNGAFCVTTVGTLDGTPDGFSFTAQTGVALSTTVTSSAITVSGINVTVPISVSGGTYSVNAGGYTGAAGTVNNGNTVSVQLVSASSPGTQTCVTLTIGGVNGTFCATTLGLPAPTATAATGISSSGFTANWNSQAGAAGYRLDVSTNSTFTRFVSGYQNLDVGNVVSRAVSGLSPGTLYYYRVRAYGAGGTSGNSNTISAATNPSSATGLKTFTVQPCRLVDTRVAGGVIPADGSRTFRVAGALSGQGGASDCQVPFPRAKGVYINVVAVLPSGSGYLTVSPYPLLLPSASTLNFSTGQIIANGVLVPICDEATDDCTPGDITVTMGQASSHVVIDVSGYVQSLP